MDNNASVRVKALRTRLRKGFYQGANLSYEARVKNLKSLRAAIEKLNLKIQEAVLKDLSRSYFMTSATETEGMIDTINYYLANLKKFMKDTPKDLPALLAPGTAYVKYEPYGVALIIGSWNFPFATTLHPLIGALAAGNVVCVKPSEVSENSSHVIKEILDSLNPDVFGCIEGGVDVAVALLEQQWDLIAFTGSSDKGKLIAAAAAKYLTPVVLELGGKNPCIVDKDANMDNAVKRIVQGRFLNAGQLCISPDLVLVHSSRLDEFLEGLKNTITQFFGQDPKLSKDYARIINDMHTKRISKLLENHKGTIVIGGQIDLPERYISPTVVLSPDKNSPLAKEEVFGPVLVVFPFNSIEECIEEVNSRDKPLALYYFGSSRQHLEALKNSTSSGSVTWNDCVYHYICGDVPFGGVGNSGISKIFGEEGFRAMSHAKGVFEKYALNPYPLSIRYPPFTESNQRLYFFLKKYTWISYNKVFKAAQITAVAGLVVALAYNGYLEPAAHALSSAYTSVLSLINPRI
jgi:aldehyde dehydrogenase (NAD+)